MGSPENLAPCSPRAARAQPCEPFTQPATPPSSLALMQLVHAPRPRPAPPSRISLAQPAYPDSLLSAATQPAYTRRNSTPKQLLRDHFVPYSVDPHPPDRKHYNPRQPHPHNTLQQPPPRPRFSSTSSAFPAVKSPTRPTIQLHEYQSLIPPNPTHQRPHHSASIRAGKPNASLPSSMFHQRQATWADTSSQPLTTIVALAGSTPRTPRRKRCPGIAPRAG